MNFNLIKSKYKELKYKFDNNKKEKVRIIILFFAIIFIFDYLMFCLHTDKNIFNIFPSFPLLEENKKIVISLPSIDARSIIQEKRKVLIFDNDIRYARYLFETFLNGSFYENTTTSFPLNIFLRNVWMYDAGEGSKTCVFDFDPLILSKNVENYNQSEEIFKKALEKTIVENISNIKKIIILENGIPGKNIWSLVAN